MTAQQLKTLEDEVVNLRLSLEQFSASQQKVLLKPYQDRQKLLKLFGAWDGEIETTLDELMPASNSNQ